MVPWRRREENFMEVRVTSSSQMELKTSVLWILQVELIVDLARARGVLEMKTVSECRSFKKFD